MTPAVSMALPLEAIEKTITFQMIRLTTFSMGLSFQG
jgi:hypothetical protein